MVRAARARGEDLTGPDGLLKAITATVLETGLEEEMTEHLGHERHHAPPGESSGNIRNGTRPKTVLTDAAGQVEVEVPRDRAGTFEPVIVKKRQRRLTDVDAVAISLYAKGLTTGGISAHLHWGCPLHAVLGGGVRREHLQGHHLADHRRRRGRDAGVVLKAAAGRVRGGVH